MDRPPLLFACSRCFSRHPFEELSAGQQLCKECQDSTPMKKCGYCRTEYPQLHKTQSMCKKCDYNFKSYGKPRACEYCNLISAFVGHKCQRCMSSEAKYGPPTNCEQCKQKSAFNRSDMKKKSGGKILCWLCTLSYKRALEKTKNIDDEKKTKSRNIQNNENYNSNKRTYDQITEENKSMSPTLSQSMPPIVKNALDDTIESGEMNAFNKFPRSNSIKSELDINNTENFVTINQLKEKINFLQKQLTQKDQQLLSKDKQITELKAKHFTMETELRNKMKQISREHDNKVEQFNIKMQSLMKKVATLSKSSKRTTNENKNTTSTTRDNNSGSGTDSPSFN